MARTNQPATARRRYDSLVAATARRVLPARCWYGIAIRLFKASRLVTGERSTALWDRGLDAEARAERAVAQAEARRRHAVRIAIPVLREAHS